MKKKFFLTLALPMATRELTSGAICYPISTPSSSNPHNMISSPPPPYHSLRLDSSNAKQFNQPTRPLNKTTNEPKNDEALPTYSSSIKSEEKAAEGPTYYPGNGPLSLFVHSCMVLPVVVVCL